MNSLLLLMVLKVFALTGGTMHVWNPTPSMVSVSFGTTASIIAPYQSIDLALDVDVFNVSDDRIRVWRTIDGSDYEAVKPKTEWRIPVDYQTGIAVFNPGPDTDMTFSLEKPKLGIEFTGRFFSNSRLTMFAHELFRSELKPGETGTLVIKSIVPVVVTGARCTTFCSPIIIE